MSELIIQLDQLLKKIGISHSVPDTCGEGLHQLMCQLLCVDKVSDLSFQHLDEMSCSLDYIILIEEGKKS